MNAATNAYFFGVSLPFFLPVVSLLPFSRARSFFRISRRKNWLYRVWRKSYLTEFFKPTDKKQQQKRKMPWFFWLIGNKFSTLVFLIHQILFHLVEIPYRITVSGVRSREYLWCDDDGATRAHAGALARSRFSRLVYSPLPIWHPIWCCCWCRERNGTRYPTKTSSAVRSAHLCTFAQRLARSFECVRFWLRLVARSI